MQSELAFGVDSLDLLVCREAFGKCAGISNELGHPPPAVKFFQDSHHGLTFGLRLREPHGVLQFVFWNINSGLHASIIWYSGIHIKHRWNPCLSEEAFRAVWDNPDDGRIRPPVSLGDVVAGRDGICGTCSTREEHHYIGGWKRVRSMGSFPRRARTSRRPTLSSPRRVRSRSPLVRR